MSNFYQNKNIWIIGASFGIGEELFLQLKQMGANLAISARSEEKLMEIIGNQNNNFALPMDVCNPNSILTAVNILQEKWQKIDLIIFCAGSYQPMNVNNFNLIAAKNIIDINLLGFVNLLEQILPPIKEKKVAHLAIISSVAGYFGMHNSLGYGASKAGLSNLAESLYLELEPHQTKVTLVNPGFVKTRLTEKNSFKMPFIITPKKAASIIIKNLPKNKFEIAFPRLFTWIMKLVALMPYEIKFIILAKMK